MGFQQLIVSGNLAKDPETKYLASGVAITEISVPVSEKWKDKNSGEMQETTEWFNITFFNKQAETIAQYMKKGSGITCTCKVKTDSWDQDGVKRTAKKFQGLSFTFVGGPASGASNSSPAQNQAQPAPPPQNNGGQTHNTNFDSLEDDVPF